MGSSQSTEKKPASLVLLPSTPTEFSPALVSKLQSSIESDYTRSQYTEKYIEDQVNSRLQEFAKNSASTLQDLISQADKSIGDSKSEDDDLSSAKLQEKLAGLKKSLESRRERHVLNEETQKSRDEVVSCLKKFQNKPMKCIEQVEAFKAEVKKYEQSVL